MVLLKGKSSRLLIKYLSTLFQRQLGSLNIMAIFGYKWEFYSLSFPVSHSIIEYNFFFGKKNLKCEDNTKNF